MQTSPRGRIRFRDRCQLFPRKPGLNRHDVACWYARVFGVAAVDGPSHAAHQSCYFLPDGELTAGAGCDESDTFDAAHLRSLRPLAFSHVSLRMIYSERFDLDDYMAGHRFRIRKVLHHQLLRAAVLLYDDRFHKRILQS